jgi:Na+/H+ antiporter NhaD/arsenite permease-like protein
MLLIRPWIAMNRNDFGGIHTAFFIFTVSNMGGALLPVGPPLFLGYLKGVPFWWALQRCWLPWSVTLAAVLIIFCVLESLHFRKRHPSDEGANESAAGETWHCDGATNFIFMLVLLAALIAAPAGWREVIMVSIAVAAYLFTPRQIHRANDFTFAPIKEVAWIFSRHFPNDASRSRLHGNARRPARSAFGFAILLGNGRALGVARQCSDLSHFPRRGIGVAGSEHGQRGTDVRVHFQARSSPRRNFIGGATCFGALTYIGNGPNLLVKAIAEHAKIETPSFFGYAFKFAIPVLAPIFIFLVSILFFRN